MDDEDFEEEDEENDGYELTEAGTIAIKLWRQNIKLKEKLRQNRITISNLYQQLNRGKESED